MTALRDLHKNDKPREKLLNKGVEALKNDELLAILLGSGVQGKDVRKLAKEIVSLMDDSFEHLTLDKLCDIHGLGIAKASQILASLELSKRFEGCVSLADNTIYPCSIGCGNEGVTPPRGYVYYQNKLMSLGEFNRITNQNIVIQ